MSAAPLPNGEAQFIDGNGAPYALGTVGFYEPGGLTPKVTWQDYNQATQNTNPVSLDAAGRAIIWGVGRYRTILKDAAGNTIWDQETLGAPDVSTTSLVLEGFYEGDTTPGISAFLDGHVLPANVQVPGNFVGSYLHVQSAFLPTATYVISIQKNDVEVGTLTIHTDGTYALHTTVANGFTAVVGDRITLIGQATPDATLNRFFWTFVLSIVT